MKVLINHKICDMSPACDGIRVCPTGALFWDDAAEKIGYDESKCIGCGACANSCPVARAIRFAKTDEQAAEIEKEYADDPRRAEDLFVDRYGADCVLTKETPSERAMDAVRAAPGLAVMELNREDLVRCLLVSVPMREIFAGREYKHVKVIDPSPELAAELGVSEFPALVFFRGGEQIGKIEGYFENVESERGLLINKVKKIIG